MKAKTSLPAKLASVRPITDPYTLTDEYLGWSVRLAVVRSDSLAAELKSIQLISLVHSDQPLTPIIPRLVDRLQQHLGPLVTVEVDDRLHGAQLRSKTVQEGEYYEVRIHPHDSATPNRYAVTVSRFLAIPGQVRQAQKFTLTHQTLDSLVHEMITSFSVNR